MHQPNSKFAFSALPEGESRRSALLTDFGCLAHVHVLLATLVLGLSFPFFPSSVCAWTFDLSVTEIFF